MVGAGEAYARMILQLSDGFEAEETSREEEELIAEFGDLIDAPDEPQELLSDSGHEEFFYLWDTKLKIFELFKLVRLYLKDGVLDSALIIDRCAKRGIDDEEALADLPLILSGYLSILYPKPDKQSKETPDERPD